MEISEHKSTWAMLDRKEHVKKLIDGLTKPLPKEYASMMPQQTWTVYWIAHSLALMGQDLSSVTEDVIKMISACAHPDGGYGGGPGQIAHLATTFAAVNALITMDNEEALETIDRVKLLSFVHRLKQPDGSFRMHEDGEIDSRATYCALATLRVLNINDPILLESVPDWILSCQTYEGGFGATPGNEAHGGYTFCCVASLCLVNQLHRANLPSLIRWLTNKQLEADGGFCGRSNKLVDSCYSYWQGAVFPLLHPYLSLNQDGDDDIGENLKSASKSRDASPVLDEDGSLLDGWLYDRGALQEYILNKCQVKGGLLRDKPGAKPDFYHTCYALSGLSLSQHQPGGSIFDIGSKISNKVELGIPFVCDLFAMSDTRDMGNQAGSARKQSSKSTDLSGTTTQETTQTTIQTQTTSTSTSTSDSSTKNSPSPVQSQNGQTRQTPTTSTKSVNHQTQQDVVTSQQQPLPTGQPPEVGANANVKERSLALPLMRGFKKRRRDKMSPQPATASAASGGSAPASPTSSINTGHTPLITSPGGTSNPIKLTMTSLTEAAETGRSVIAVQRELDLNTAKSVKEPEF